MEISLLPERPASGFGSVPRTGRKMFLIWPKCYRLPFPEKCGREGVSFFDGISPDPGTC